MDNSIEHVGINNYTDKTNLCSIEYNCPNCKTEVVVLGQSTNKIINIASISTGYSEQVFCPICGHKVKLNICN